MKTLFVLAGVLLTFILMVTIVILGIGTAFTNGSTFGITFGCVALATLVSPFIKLGFGKISQKLIARNHRKSMGMSRFD